MLATSTPYHVAFDITEAGFRYWWFSASGLAAVVAGLLMVRWQGRLTQLGAPRARRVFAWFFLSFGTLWTLAAFTGTYGEYRRLVAAVEAGNVAYVEGIVENFVPMPYSGHSMERFEVEGKRFEYSDYALTSGFNNTRSHGGPIRAGRRVRIGYVGNTIVRLEVAP